ncbi:hypothetical protein [Hydrogenophaga sp.]|uniref:hypothetical protein n=1 Tax=Hydrogenophaga sp. TaxID=1904254 RepID=UPI002639F698|nr:hypothetical protein [Hydrogenophaga sp.]
MGVTLVVCLLCAPGSAEASPDGALYQCPRNLFTNQIDEAQARLQGCSRVAPGRLTQGLVPALSPLPPAVPYTATTTTVAPVVATASTPAVGEPTAAPVTPAVAPVPAGLAPVAAVTPVATQPMSVVPVQTPGPAAMRVASTQQRARDQDAQAILRSELSRIQSAQRELQRASAAPNADQTATLNRLREDEVALRRELARFNP